MGRKRTTNKHLPQHLYLRNRKGKPYLLRKPDGSHQSFSNLPDASAAWAYYWAPGNTAQIADCMDEYARNGVPQLRDRTQQDYLRILARLRPVFGHMDMRDLRPHHLMQYRDLRAKTSPHQANQELAVMSEVCKVAIGRGLINANPCRQVGRVTTHPREVDVTWADFSAVFNHARPVQQVAMLLIASTGMRPADPRLLLRSAWHDDGLRYIERKSQRGAKKRGGKKRHWAWSPTLRWCYQRGLEIQNERPSIYFLASPNGGPFTANHWSQIFRAARQKALDAGEIEQEFQLKDIRAMAANESTNPFELLQHGNGSVTMRHYANRRARTTTPVI